MVGAFGSDHDDDLGASVDITGLDYFCWLNLQLAPEGVRVPLQSYMCQSAAAYSLPHVGFLFKSGVRYEVARTPTLSCRLLQPCDPVDHLERSVLCALLLSYLEQTGFKHDHPVCAASPIKDKQVCLANHPELYCRTSQFSGNQWANRTLTNSAI